VTTLWRGLKAKSPTNSQQETENISPTTQEELNSASNHVIVEADSSPNLEISRPQLEVVSVPFPLVILEMGSLKLFVWAGLQLISASQIAKITSVSHQYPVGHVLNLLLIHETNSENLKPFWEPFDLE
jgi:hypothetical protein